VVPQATARRRAARQRRLDTAGAIRQATATLLLERRWAALSVDDVARAAGLSRTAFYRFYPDLGAVLQDLLAGLVRELAAANAVYLVGAAAQPAIAGGDDRRAALADRADALGRALTATAAIFHERRHLLTALIDASAADDDLERAYRRAVGTFIAATERRIRADQTAGLVDHGVDPSTTAACLVWMTERVLWAADDTTPQWHRPTTEPTPEPTAGVLAGDVDPGEPTATASPEPGVDPDGLATGEPRTGPPSGATSTTGAVLTATVEALRSVWWRTLYGGSDGAPGSTPGSRPRS
jgi:AcrR family transcriptional regulator